MRDELMFAASLSLVPVVLVLEFRSEPAKSMMESLLTTICDGSRSSSPFSPDFGILANLKVTIECPLLES
jgi:hypothetical protein